MILIYFLYGLAFFTLGTSTLFYPKQNSRFQIAKTLSLIALFGIFHGMNEWIDMFKLLQKPTGITPLIVVGTIILPVSYFFLLLFGTKSLSQLNNKYSGLNRLPILLLITWIIITTTSTHYFLIGNIWARYLLGVPGTFLTSYALILYLPYFKKNIPSITLNIKIAAITFFFYGIFSGIIVPEAGFFPASFINDAVFINKVDIPIQVFRTFCAIVLAYSMLSILRIFNWETNKLHMEIAERKKMEQQLKEAAITDVLTGCLNRRGFFTLADHQCKIATRSETIMALLYIDLDGLKVINDELGHEAGDQALVDIATIFKKTFRSSDIIARIGGDEFAVLLTDLSNLHNEKTIINHLQDNLTKHNELKIRKYELGISIGVAYYQPEASCSVSELLNQADELMYENKNMKK